jgi:peroxiredoxin
MSHSRSVLFALPLFLALGCAPTQHETKPNGPAGQEGSSSSSATDFTLRDLEGKTVRLSDFLNKDVILLDFWATWCVSCGAELPHLESLYRSHRDKGFVVLGIDIDGPETVAQVGSFARRYDLTFPVLLDEETRVVGLYNPKRVAPMTILIDRRGRIARVRNGYNAGDERLIAQDVQNLLAQ